MSVRTDHARQRAAFGLVEHVAQPRLGRALGEVALGRRRPRSVLTLPIVRWT
jgi:hypothetical protein